MSESLDSQSFNKNDRILKETADWLSRQEEPDIDQRVPRVERAMGAYRICKERLEVVQQTLGQYLRDGKGASGVATPSADGVGRMAGLRPSVDGHVDGDDIPY
jgi:exodeoxyribonuclease VII small subunit